ncbi:MAG: TetR/AcrR family transcriptional regulator [Rhodococcus fascians]|uniref:TetR/AcrR family transcriptional regulator n=1 Tax=Nocardiaceae TaxID=85025 RepID=UPI000522EB84|nr:MULTISPECIES: TetR/AcrR family transcriptional regulator [Rhodococcus]OZC52173.1 TetR/AcrR family transcriptional regulator [Rhodococcus sp. 06-621-2]OZD10023.1 TetR/AcrR family transcriptional regulator [Rhodococcus sp. 06-156-4C]OZD21930.1 TetR/AcrR family transcriptional regulator [Rhodococcus sp. 06-156-3C]OZD24185.1 TetR/AcrR family transcriptional regulator [Rhodococcus sp. 06-156-4a]OZD29342.1 TetR/AcrR family transcriptional regulator [Rhodococcus sp. 06-156-3b]
MVPVLAGVFGDLGWNGSSLSVISKRTGLGKGSLYHFFPRGKTEMAEAVLDEVERWFQSNVFAPLRAATDARARSHDMFAQTSKYFQSGRRVCLFAAFSLGEERALFGSRVAKYFSDWIDALTPVLRQLGHGDDARGLAEEIVAGIQGALVLSRTSGDTRSFERLMSRLETAALGTGSMELAR